uniref:Uncharacterized protein n=1 Tax=Amphimedon queenslandica TaxID=400682 RepID=A0A1X7T0E1_AMPQE
MDFSGLRPITSLFTVQCTSPITVLQCNLNLSQGSAPYTVAVSINCNREATTNCSIASLPSHQYVLVLCRKLEAHDQYGYTCFIVSVFTVQP